MVAQHRRVMVVGWVVDEGSPYREAPGTHESVVTRPDEVRALLVETATGCNARVVVEGAERPWRGSLQALHAVAPRGASGRLIGVVALLPGAPNSAGPALMGRAATVWCPHPSSIVAFRSSITGATADRLFLDLPPSLMRYSRRGAPRVPVPAGTGPAAAIPLDGGDWLREAPVLDLSTTGLGVLLPYDVEFPQGGIARIGVRMPESSWLPLMVRCRHVRPLEGAGMRHGLELLDPPRAAIHALERCVAWLQHRAAPEVTVERTRALAR